MINEIVLFLVAGKSLILNNEIPIKMYKTVQTGPKIPFGGLNDGLFKLKYQP